jgi:hypothetical protein
MVAGPGRIIQTTKTVPFSPHVVFTRATTATTTITTTQHFQAKPEKETSVSSEDNIVDDVGSRSIPCPDGLSYLPFQKEVILNYLIPSSSPLSSSGGDRKGILLGDEMGLGKTISVIGGINVLLRDHFCSRPQHPSGNDETSEQQQEQQHPKRPIRRFRTLIVAPKSVLSHWEYELNRWIVLPPDARVVQDCSDDENTKTENGCLDDCDSAKPRIGTISAKDGMPTMDCDIYLVNYEIVGKYLEEILTLFQGDRDNSNHGDAPT